MSKRGPRDEVTSTLCFLGLAAVIGYVILAAKLGIPFAIPVGVIGAISAGIVLRGPLGQYLARGGARGDALPDETTGQLLGEIDDLRNRVAELEERVDFSERLLARQPKGADQ
jgi:hypothetical protein